MDQDKKIDDIHKFGGVFIDFMGEHKHLGDEDKIRVVVVCSCLRAFREGIDKMYIMEFLSDCLDIAEDLIKESKYAKGDKDDC